MSKSAAEMRQLLEDSERLWNGGDRNGFLTLWERAVRGDFTLESPVGTPPKKGFDACRREVWDQYQATSRPRTTRLIAYPNEAAAVVEYEITTPAGKKKMVSIEITTFDDTGNIVERNFIEQPQRLRLSEQ
jgi:hypothetical protein